MHPRHITCASFNFYDGLNDLSHDKFGWGFARQHWYKTMVCWCEKTICFKFSYGDTKPLATGV